MYEEQTGEDFDKEADLSDFEDADTVADNKFNMQIMLVSSPIILINSGSILKTMLTSRSGQ